MTELERKQNIKSFISKWKDKGYEKGESQSFWLELLNQVLGVENPSGFIRFEEHIQIDKVNGFIDGYIDATKVLIEQKSVDKDLRKAIKQSDGSLLNPFQQALRYANELNNDDRPRWIVTCNFKSFLIYDLNNRNAEPEEVFLKDLVKEYYRLLFLVDVKSEHLKKEEELSFKAGELVGQLYDAFSKQYINLEDEYSHKSLNELCVRLVFCLYAEDAGLFGRKNVFNDYLAKYEDLNQMRKALIELFKVLDTPLDKRDKYLEDDLNQFPYVNGGLFANEEIEIPTFSEEIRTLLLSKAANDFNWAEISPTIFGAVFESTLNPETRRKGGMHYTSIENIHKVIDPLFLEDLREKLDKVLSYKNEKTRNEEILKFQDYISSLNFLDPACGSGNFLTETYLSLRRLENEALSAFSRGKMMLGIQGIIKVSIQQFYGIEINDFAVKVAKTALWIAEAQMWNETRDLISSSIKIEDFLPLETYDNIVKGNALRIDWNDVVLNKKCSYIMGNPPFVGHQYRTIEQIDDMKIAFYDLKIHGKLDYVCGWYNKALDYMKNNNILCAFVSTNSICQGESVGILWKHLFFKGLQIQFANKSFLWNSEAQNQAHVYCVIVGFSSFEIGKEKLLIDNNRKKKVEHINGYLIDAENIFIESRSSNINKNIPKIIKGSQPTDGGYLILTEEEKNKMINTYPNSKNFIREYIGAKELLNNQKRWCLWLVGVEPVEYKNNILIMDRLKKIVDFRSNSPTKSVNEDSKKPMLFTQIRQPNDDYLAIPEVSASNRKYIPIGYLSADVICSNLLHIIPNANIYIFGILNSLLHNSWMRVVCGRLGNGYRYTPLVYNNFPWPTPNDETKIKIERTAQAILDARALYPNSSLADLYDSLTMPVELRKAHQENDKAVMEAYGFNWRKMTESECVTELMKMYQEKINELKENN